MNTDFRELLPPDFDPESRVWIYQSSRLFSIPEALEIEEILKHFVDTWNSHGTPVKGYANLFFGQFIVLIADERQHGVSGCSTDSSVRMVREIEELFQVHLFDRLTLAFILKERVQVLPLIQLSHGLQNRFITAETLYFNNTVQTLAQLRSSWLIPVKDSWLAKDRRYSELIAETRQAVSP